MHIFTCWVCHATINFTWMSHLAKLYWMLTLTHLTIIITSSITWLLFQYFNATPQLSLITVIPRHSRLSLSLCVSKSRSKSHCDLFLWAALSDERTGLPFVHTAGPLPVQSFSGLSPLGLATIFYCLIFETSLFIASYYSQGHGGDIWPGLHTGAVRYSS
jgi:hypothetical protein